MHNYVNCECCGTFFLGENEKKMSTSLSPCLTNSLSVFNVNTFLVLQSNFSFRQSVPVFTRNKRYLFCLYDLYS